MKEHMVKIAKTTAEFNDLKTVAKQGDKIVWIGNNYDHRFIHIFKDNPNGFFHYEYPEGGVLKP